MEKMRIALAREPMAHAPLAHVACLLGMHPDSVELERIVQQAGIVSACELVAAGAAGR